ncbi:hypothetical protein GCM10020216_045180 [Nonomuraea helvata]
MDMLRTHLAVLSAAIVGASLLSTVDPRPAVAASALTCSAVVPVYGIDGGGKLRWYGHRAGASGEDSWAADSGKEIGYGWNTLAKVFSGGNGVIYAVDSDGDLKWYRHLDPATGERGWAPGERTVIGHGWGDFVDIVSAGSGVIYALDKAGDLHWYRHLSPTTGEAQWAPGSGKVIRSGWTAITTLMTGRDGTLYGVNTKGHVRWYDHTDPAAGGTAFGPGTGLVTGEGWEDYRSPSGAGAGVVYALDASGRMWWHHHADPLAGAPVWQDRRPLKDGFASFTALFADAAACSAGQSFTGYAPGTSGQNLYFSQGRVGAVLTEGARTAVTYGRQRKFAETTTEATVSTRAWVRLLPGPWSPSAPWAASWPAANIARTDEDLLDIATQYLADAPSQVRDGLRYAGDAHYGPLLPDGTREEGSDFNDYLGLAWTYDDRIDPPGSPAEGIAGLFRFRQNGPWLPRRLPPGHRRHAEQVRPSPSSRPNGRRERPGDHRDRRWHGQTHVLRGPADGRPAVLGRQHGRRHSPRPRRHLSGNRLHRQTPVHLQPQNGRRSYAGRRRRPLNPRQRHALRPLMAQGQTRLTSARRMSVRP